MQNLFDLDMSAPVAQPNSGNKPTQGQGLSSNLMDNDLLGGGAPTQTNNTFGQQSSVAGQPFQQAQPTQSLVTPVSYLFLIIVSQANYPLFIKQQLLHKQINLEELRWVSQLI